jgi:hypothetical protein
MVFYAIPSYKRPDGLYKKTLTTLKKYSIPVKDITIFLHSNEEKEEYEKIIPKEYYGKIVVHNLPKGIKGVRNYIMDYYPLNAEYVSLDDDVSGFLEPKNGKLKHIKSLKEIVSKAYKICKEKKLSMWGFYPVCNAYFMKGDPITYDLRFIVGGCMGFINKRRYVTLNLKVDYELTLINYTKDGGVLRFNNICVRHTTFSKKGGIEQNHDDRLAEYKKVSDILIKKYPEYVILNKKREGEILFTRKKDKSSPTRKKNIFFPTRKKVASKNKTLKVR